MSVNGQNIQKIEPPYWWVGMNNNRLELMIYGEDIAQYIPSIKNSAIQLVEVKKTDNNNYLFLNLNLSKATVGKFAINFSKADKKTNFSVDYELKQRIENSNLKEGFSSSDVIYLITPDRFANSDISNDKDQSLRETSINRKDDYARHGGDIKGITAHLDYISSMGFTAIWPTPLLINDMKESSYHGYAMTDLYKVDPRFGTLEDYIELSNKARNNGLKLIMDQVENHIGNEHWWMKDLPANDWINYQKEAKEGNFIITNHRRTANQDFYASEADKKLLIDGWFVDGMPDLNQNNPLLSTYLIQNSIWWVETLNLGGIRQDTYPYSSKEFMAKWAGSIMEEYPNFSIVGEEWSLNPLLVGYWQKGAKNKDGYQSNLTSTMDFPMQRAIVNGLNEEESWDTGFVKLYEGLANDFSYANPENIMIFPDNHDMSRIYTQLHQDVLKTKMALGYLLALPRIVQIYYGTEVLLSDAEKPGDHGLIRTDFPGGWQGDSVNAFTGEGLSEKQIEMQWFLKTVLNYRKNSEAIHSGKTIHFAPENGVYVLFRIKGNEIVTVILNKNENEIELDLTRFAEVGLTGQKVKNINTSEEFTWSNSIKLNGKGIYILTTKL
ncbi:alpha-amylase family glycosyl hydrolase [Lutibacter sp.]|uniref:alpha-amylase family glycosyl hydrolase n=1 Tax=Lutibacter sp. TaxID=1925666 RepID=UPI003564D169